MDRFGRSLRNVLFLFYGTMERVAEHVGIRQLPGFVCNVNAMLDSYIRDPAHGLPDALPSTPKQTLSGTFLSRVLEMFLILDGVKRTLLVLYMHIYIP